MSFTTTKMVNERVLVRGTDVLGTEGSIVLDATQWNSLTARSNVDQAQAEFDQAVEEFFRPIEEAAAKLGQAVERPHDSLSYVVLNEEVKATPGQPAEVVRLTHDSMVLRLLEQGDHNRLVWVGDGIEILEADAPATDVAVDETSVIAGE